MVRFSKIANNTSDTSKHCMVSEPKDLVLQADEYHTPSLAEACDFVMESKAPATRAGALCGSVATHIWVSYLVLTHLQTTIVVSYLPETGSNSSRGETTKQPLSDCPGF